MYLGIQEVTGEKLEIAAHSWLFGEVWRGPAWSCKEQASASSLHELLKYVHPYPHTPAHLRIVPWVSLGGESYVMLHALRIACGTNTYVQKPSRTAFLGVRACSGVPFAHACFESG